MRIHCTYDSSEKSASIQLFDVMGSIDSKKILEGEGLSSSVRRDLLRIQSASLTDSKVDKAVFNLSELSSANMDVIVALSKLLAGKRDSIRATVTKSLERQIRLGLKDERFSSIRFGIDVRFDVPREPLEYSSELHDVQWNRMLHFAIAKAIVGAMIELIESANHPLSAISSEIALIEETVKKQRIEIAKKFEKILNTFLVETSFRTIEEKIAAVNEIRDAMKRLTLRVLCPKCGVPSTVHVSKSSTKGTLILRHPVDGRITAHGGESAVGNFRVVPISADNALAKSAK